MYSVKQFIMEIKHKHIIIFLRFLKVYNFVLKYFSMNIFEVELFRKNGESWGIIINGEAPIFVQAVKVLNIFIYNRFFDCAKFSLFNFYARYLVTYFFFKLFKLDVS